MAALVLDGKALAAEVRAGLRDEVDALAAAGARPGLAVVLVGQDPASQVYVRGKARACEEAGIAVFDHKLAKDTREDDLITLVRQLDDDPRVHGILVQLPLPAHLRADRVIAAISPAKDVDAFHPETTGRLFAGTPTFVPCTPAGCMRLLALSGVSLPGARAVVVGRSNIVGKPMAQLLLAAHATVTVCHSQTRELAAEVARADVLVAALGRPEAIRGAWIKEGAVVIDVGINRVEGTKKLVGDVEYAPAAERARAITPVPGGVGPMTIAMLLVNTVQAARQSAR